MSPRAAVTVYFALEGFAVAWFFARLPAIQDRLNLSNAAIGLALLALAVALVIAQPPAGAIAFCVLLAEGAIGDWSAIHLAETLSASEATAEATSLRLALAAVLGLLCLTAAALASAAR